MSFLLVLSASALSAPLPITAKQLGPAQYPSEFAAADKSTAAILELVISREGKTVQCQPLQTHGDEQFAQRLCGLQNAHSWSAAKDADNAPAFGLVRVLFRMFMPGTEQGDEIAALTQSPDLELGVNALPASTQGYLDAKVSLWVDASGSATQCEPRPGQTVPAVYLKLACEQARSLIKFDSVTLEGKLLPSFAIEQKVRFVIEPKH